MGGEVGGCGGLQGQAGTTPCSRQWARQARGRGALGGGGSWGLPGGAVVCRLGTGVTPGRVRRREGVYGQRAAEAVVAGTLGRPPRLGLQDSRWRCCPRLEGVAGRDPELRARPQPRARRGLGSHRIPRAAWCLNGGKKSFEAVFSHRAHMSPFLFLCWFLWGQRAAVSAPGEGASGSLQGIKHFAEPGRSGGPEKATWGGVLLLLQGLSRGCRQPV